MSGLSGTVCYGWHHVGESYIARALSVVHVHVCDFVAGLLPSVFA
jgi:hypothetical protein